MNSLQKLETIIIKNKSMLCVGLDSDTELIPKGISIFDFNRAIIDATSDLVCAYKPNLAFYEVLGSKGIEILSRTIEYIPKDIPVILDCKHNDIGNTAKKYAKAVFDTLKVDAVTVNPYLGYDSVEPFLEYRDKLSFILCLTSNKGAKDFQYYGDKLPLYEFVAHKIVEWNKNNNCGLVVGATYPDELKNIRKIIGKIPILIPGVGSQGGDLEKSILHGTSGNSTAIFNVSRSVIFSSKNSDFAESARQETLKIVDIMRNTLYK